MNGSMFPSLNIGLSPIELPGEPGVMYAPETGEYVFDKILTASTEYLGQVVPIEGDSLFIWLSLRGTYTSASFQVRFKNPSGRYMANAYMNAGNIVGTAQFPWVLPIGSNPYRASGTLALDIKDTSGSSNTVQLVFGGIKLFRV